MSRLTRFGLLALLGATATLAGAAQDTRALAQAAGGMWEVSSRADGHGATKLCVATPEVLAQYEHRQRRCARSVVSDSGTEAVIHYSCAGGDFGHSQVKLLTPRTLRIDTQGISGNQPFHYQLHARRVGDCVSR